MALSKEFNRFEDIDDEDLDALRKDLQNGNTRKSDKKCETITFSKIAVCYKYTC